jgi:integrase
MGSVFRKITTRPLPEGAELFTRRRKVTTRLPDGTRQVDHVTEHCARWRDANGKPRVELVTTARDGSPRIRQESGTYFAKYRDHDGVVHIVPTGCRDRDAAKQILSELEKRTERVISGVATPQELAVADRMTDPITQHIADYVSTLTGSASHRQHTERYLQRLVEECNWTRLSSLRRDDLELWLAAQSRPGPDGRAIRSARSRNAHHVAAVAFCNWCVRCKRLSETPFAELEMADVELDRRQIRRSLSDAEVGRLAEAARKAPKRPQARREGRPERGRIRPEERLSGEDRAFLWQFLAGTGLRLNEAKGLTVGDLVLAPERPGINLPAPLVKAKEDQYIPLRADLAAHLRHQNEGRRPCELVFAIPADILRRFKGDCKRAGIPFLDDRGRKVDIHALRTSFITGRVKAGIHPEIVRQLARHSDITITMKYYTDIRVTDLHAAVEAGSTPAPGFVTTSAAAAGASSVAPAVAPTGGNLVQPESSPVKIAAHTKSA